MSRRLIVNADDYGRTAGVSAGIRLAHRAGLVTTTTVMANLPGALDQVRLAREETPQLALGVHLNLTHGRPCASAARLPSLVDREGRFHPAAVVSAKPKAPDPRQVEIEWRAQIEAFLSTGASLDHLDSHHHVAALSPGLWEVCLSLAADYGCGVRPPCPSQPQGDPLLSDFPESARIFACTEAPRLLAARRLASPDHLITRFYGPGATLSNLLGLITGLPSGVSELMCHPGTVDEELLSGSSYAREREVELAALTDPSARRALDEGGIALSTYRHAWEEA